MSNLPNLVKDVTYFYIKYFYEEELKNTQQKKLSENDLNGNILQIGILPTFLEAIHKLNNSKKPILLVGYGLRASKSVDIFRKFINKYKIPVITTQFAKDVMYYDNNYFKTRLLLGKLDNIPEIVGR
jgi:acetolactate synthase-1/2/3 large subunit